ncbi:MAG: 50S ribosomal protein L3 [Lentisphaerae bacterium]|nr:50S ribosomal protein L3 [Lentisphaerota bacterium]
MKALIGRKLGMTRVFDGEGRQVPVTVLQAGPCTVVQRKTAASDGYEAAQLGFESQKASRLGKPVAGHCEKAGVGPFRVLREVPLEAGEEAKAGDAVTVAIFEKGGFVDVTGISKGRGFQGVMRRHNMSGQPMAHGHTMHRRPGSVGMREKPGRLLKNKRLPGHMGHVRVTTQHLQAVDVRPDDHLLLVHGSVPGPVGGLVEIRRSIKKASK